jgi:hypothetical protein
MHGFVSGSSILIHWCSCLFLCQYHAVLIVMALYYSLKSGFVMAPALDFLLRISLVIKVFCVFICILGLIFLFLCRISLDFDRDCIEYIDFFW